MSFTTANTVGIVPVRRAISGDADQMLGTIPIDNASAALSTGSFYVNDWTRDGSTALASLTRPTTARDVVVFSVQTGQVTPLFSSPASEIQPRFSPDDRRVAYASNETGRWEVFVETFPRSQFRRQISTAGGSQPVWRGDGQELFFLAPDGKLMSVPVPPGNLWGPAGAQPLFQTRMRATYAPYPLNYDVTADGQRFLINDVRPDTGPIISVITNWRVR